MKFKHKIKDLISIALMYSCTILLCLNIIKAFHSSDKKTTIYINKYGEATFEYILAYITLILATYFFFVFLKRYTNFQKKEL